MRHALSLIAAAAAIFTAAPSFAAQVDAFLKLDGVTGDSKTEPGAIDVLSFSWGASQTTTVSGSGGSGAGKASVSELTVSLPITASNKALFKALMKGEHFSSATLTCRKAGGNQLEYLKMSDLLVTSVQVGGSSEIPAESISFTFAKVVIQDNNTFTATVSTGAATDTKVPANPWSH
jgi:type VI secretion system secreted protein Hcp